MDYFMDLNTHEMTRLTAVFAACPDLDPVRMAAEEAEARALLFSGLSPEQEAIRAQLVEAGVLDA